MTMLEEPFVISVQITSNGIEEIEQTVWNDMRVTKRQRYRDHIASAWSEWEELV